VPRVLLFALSFGILGALLGAALAGGPFEREPVARALCPLLYALAFTVVGAIAGATDAIVEAIYRAGRGSAPAPPRPAAPASRVVTGGVRATPTGFRLASASPAPNARGEAGPAVCAELVSNPERLLAHVGF